MTTDEKRISWARQISFWRASGQSQHDFCRANNLAVSTFQYWKNRLAREQKNTGNFIELGKVEVVRPLVELALLEDGQLSFKLNVSLQLWG